MIKIEQKLQPFSIFPGTFFQIPGSGLFCRIFHSLIQVMDSSHNIIDQVVPEPSEDKFFCVMQDLHKIGIKIFLGKKRYGISSQGVIREGSLRSRKAYFSFEFLSLGINKKLDWEMIYRRKNLLEILPIWFRLGLLTPKTSLTAEEKKSENFLLFSSVCEEFFNHNKEKQYQLLEKLFFSCFSFNLVPRHQHTCRPNHNRINRSEQEKIPLFFLWKGALFIKSLFIKIEDNTFYILPCLLKQFHSGRLINIPCGSLGSMNLKWSKKTIKQIIFRSLHDGKVNFVFSKEIFKFRLTVLECKKRYSVLVGSSIEIKSNNTYVLDCFQK